MSNGPRPCTYCGCGQFVLASGVSMEVHSPTQVFGMEGFQRVGYMRLTMLVCTHCTRVEWFVVDPQRLLQNWPGAQVLRSSPQQPTGG